MPDWQSPQDVETPHHSDPLCFKGFRFQRQAEYDVPYMAARQDEHENHNCVYSAPYRGDSFRRIGWRSFRGSVSDPTNGCKHATQDLADRSSSGAIYDERAIT
jgi:hypothetical protein